MRLEPSDPDIETIVTRIERGDIDLQPEFQRGEVWSKAKKQRLIDSILRDWHIPPIHVIELKGTRKQEVLDGQQRLAAIRDFSRGDFTIDGRIEPIEAEIALLHDKKFRDLPDDWKRRFNQFTIRVFRIVDYRPEEPGELFFRLNQPTSLTAAEQRNAFFGPIRSQIKALVGILLENGIDKDLIGFSNSRMAYDDILARVSLTVERNTIKEKLTANDLIQAYRSDRPLKESTIYWLTHAITSFSKARPLMLSHVQFNKATLYSWFLFVIKSLSIGKEQMTPSLLGKFIPQFEKDRFSFSVGVEIDPNPIRERTFAAYESRSTARVADVSSVVIRDVTIWLEFEHFVKEKKAYEFPLDKAQIQHVHGALNAMGSKFDEDLLARLVIEAGWGKIL